MTDREIARRVVWFQDPELTLSNRRMFLSYLMTYGTHDEVLQIRAELGDQPFRETLANPVLGVLDARSWNYWHRFYGYDTVPPLPTRRFPDYGG